MTRLHPFLELSDLLPMTSRPGLPLRVLTLPNIFQTGRKLLTCDLIGAGASQDIP